MAPLTFNSYKTKVEKEDGFEKLCKKKKRRRKMPRSCRMQGEIKEDRKQCWTGIHEDFQEGWRPWLKWRQKKILDGHFKVGCYHNLVLCKPFFHKDIINSKYPLSGQRTSRWKGDFNMFYLKKWKNEKIEISAPDRQSGHLSKWLISDLDIYAHAQGSPISSIYFKNITIKTFKDFFELTVLSVFKPTDFPSYWTSTTD